MDLIEHTEQVIRRLRHLGELDVDAEMRREAAHRLTTTSTPEATEVARVLLGHGDPDGAR